MPCSRSTTGASTSASTSRTSRASAPCRSRRSRVSRTGRTTTRAGRGMRTWPRMSCSARATTTCGRWKGGETGWRSSGARASRRSGTRRCPPIRSRGSSVTSTSRTASRAIIAPCGWRRSGMPAIEQACRSTCHSTPRNRRSIPASRQRSRSGTSSPPTRSSSRASRPSCSRAWRAAARSSTTTRTASESRRSSSRMARSTSPWIPAPSPGSSRRARPRTRAAAKERAAAFFLGQVSIVPERVGRGTDRRRDRTTGGPLGPPSQSRFRAQGPSPGRRRGARLSRECGAQPGERRLARLDSRRFIRVATISGPVVERTTAAAKASMAGSS